MEWRYPYTERKQSLLMKGVFKLEDAFITEEDMILYYANKMDAVLEALETIIRKTGSVVSDITFAWKGQAAECAAEKLQEFAVEMESAKHEIMSAKSEILGGLATE